MNIKIIKKEWLMMIFASLILILSFTLDLIKYLSDNYTLKEALSFNNENLINLTTHYIPSHYNWTLFVLGELLLLITIGLFYRRVKKTY